MRRQLCPAASGEDCFPVRENPTKHRERLPLSARSRGLPREMVTDIGPIRVLDPSQSGHAQRLSGLSGSRQDRARGVKEIDRLRLPSRGRGSVWRHLPPAVRPRQYPCQMVLNNGFLRFLHGEPEIRGVRLRGTRCRRRFRHGFCRFCDLRDVRRAGPPGSSRPNGITTTQLLLGHALAPGAIPGGSREGRPQRHPCSGLVRHNCFNIKHLGILTRRFRRYAAIGKTLEAPADREPDREQLSLPAGTPGGLPATWTAFIPCFLWIGLGAPFIERLRENQPLSGALAGFGAAVVRVIPDLAIWFALHTIFREAYPARSSVGHSTCRSGRRQGRGHSSSQLLRWLRCSGSRPGPSRFSPPARSPEASCICRG
jgi:hypothetical protein